MRHFIDIHSHIHSKEFDADREATLSRMKEAGVVTITVGTDLTSSQKALALANSAEDVFASVGQHPADNREEVFEMETYKKLLDNKRAVAIGECGLDYFRAPDTSEEKKRQRGIFEQQIQLAITYKKPLMIHCRNAYEDVLDMLTAYQREGAITGNIHFFAGDTDVARKFLDLNFTCSFTGVLTFTHDYDEVVSFLPLSHILSETDCPYVAPTPLRGKRNEPAFVPYVVKQIAAIRGIGEEECTEALFNNACRVFNLSPLS